jgi:hypothetical protein
VKRFWVLSAIISLLTGCGKRGSVAAPSQTADKPGVSVVLAYPVLLIGERDLKVKDDQSSLITTTGAAGGLYYASYIFIDSAGNQYSAKSAKAFGQTPSWRDMGTSTFQAFIELTPAEKIELEKAKGMALQAVLKPGDLDGNATEAVRSKIMGTRSFAELIEVSRDPLAR